MKPAPKNHRRFEPPKKTPVSEKLRQPPPPPLKTTSKNPISNEAARGKGQEDEIKVCGANACRLIFKKRPRDIIRAYVTEAKLPEFSDLTKFCAQERKAYHIVKDADLEKISGSSHHEGICLLAKRLPPPLWENFLKSLETDKSKSVFLFILEDVENPHNAGAITRSAAHFGCKAILLPNEKNFKPSAATLRTAEGGGESVPFISAPSTSVTVMELRQLGFTVYGTATKGTLELYGKSKKELPSRLAVLLGNEKAGLSPNTKKIVDGLISIPGTGAVESLNVSVASALIAGEFYRQHS